MAPLAGSGPKGVRGVGERSPLWAPLEMHGSLPRSLPEVGTGLQPAAASGGLGQESAPSQHSAWRRGGEGAC